MHDVALDAPPSTVPPVLAGVRGPKSLGVVGWPTVSSSPGAGLTMFGESIEGAGSPDSFRVSVFTALAIGDDAREMRRIMAPFVAPSTAPTPRRMPDSVHIDEIRERHAARGVDGIADMPAVVVDRARSDRHVSMCPSSLLESPCRRRRHRRGVLPRPDRRARPRGSPPRHPPRRRPPLTPSPSPTRQILLRVRGRARP